MSYGLSMLAMSVIAAISVVVMLWSLMGDQSTDADIERRSRGRILNELRRIERDRPHFFVQSDDDIYNNKENL